MFFFKLRKYYFFLCKLFCRNLFYKQQNVSGEICKKNFFGEGIFFVYLHSRKISGINIKN